MGIIFWLLFGVLSSGLLLKSIHHKPLYSRISILGYTLIIAALFYVIFAFLYSNLTWIGIESLGVLIYSLFFVLSKNRGLYYLAIGWLLHPVWDVGLHLFGPGDDFAPRWYVIMCISFDITVASYLLIQARVGEKPNKPNSMGGASNANESIQ